MSDYIKREDALSQFSELLEDYVDEAHTVIYEFSGDIDESIKELKKDIAKRKKKFVAIPSADVAPVRHGKWQGIGRTAVTCSLCGAWTETAGNYCPNCGAKMEGEKDD